MNFGGILILLGVFALLLLVLTYVLIKKKINVFMMIVASVITFMYAFYETDYNEGMKFIIRDIINRELSHN